MSNLRLTLLKQTDGPWEQVKGYVHDDLEQLEIALNRWAAQVPTAAEVAAAGSVTITDVLPAAILLAPSQKKAPVIDPIPTAFLFGGGM